MIQQELLADPKPPCNDTRRLIVGYASTDKPGVDVPYVHLRGRWLQDAGFVIGRYVKEIPLEDITRAIVVLRVERCCSTQSWRFSTGWQPSD